MCVNDIIGLEIYMFRIYNRIIAKEEVNIVASENQRIDILNRDAVMEDLFCIVQSASKNQAYCPFAIEGAWGVGKTFILEGLEKKLEIEMNEDTFDNRYFVFHYNCWKYDYYEEPAIAIVSALKDKVDKELFKELEGKIKDSWKVAQKAINGMAKEFVKNKIGIDLVQVYEDIKEEGDARQKKEKEFDTLFAFNSTLNSVREQIKKLAEDKTVVVVVDELDRCMPSYAIKILERLHHMFEGINNVLLIVAVDSNQLEQSVREIYGDTVDTERYLKKFISFRYKIGVGETQKSVIEKFEDYFRSFSKYTDVDETLAEFLRLSGLDVRTIEKLMEKCKLIHNLVCDREVSNSVLLYEIMCMVLEYIGLNSGDGLKGLRQYGKDLYWIPDINLSSYGYLDECIGKGMLQFLEGMVKCAMGSTIYPRDMHSINMHPEGKCIGYMDINLSKKKKLRFAEETDEIKYEIEVCKNFNRMCKRIS